MAPLSFRQCTKENMIPDDVLINILKIYAFGEKEDIKKLPNNLVCLENGDFWTTWDKIIEIREMHKKMQEKNENSLG
jgi:hypothetical protein